MAEGEDVITDAARHATVFARQLWRRHRPAQAEPHRVALDDVAPRIDLLVVAVFGSHYPIRVAQPPARTTLLSHLSRRDPPPRQQQAIPATDGAQIWLPRQIDIADPVAAAAWYRTAALQQAMRIQRGSAIAIQRQATRTVPPSHASTPLLRDLYLLLEAYSADEALAALLPGMQSAIDAARQLALSRRPPLSSFPQARQPLEEWLRRLLARPCGQVSSDIRPTSTPEQSVIQAGLLCRRLALDPRQRGLGIHPLLKDCWTGEFRPAAPLSSAAHPQSEPRVEHDESSPPRSARLERRPEIREASEQDDDRNNGPGAWILHPDQPHEHAEDPMGLQRPIDRDDETSAGEFGELLSELPEARLVSTPGTPREVLLSDDPPETRTRPLPRHARPVQQAAQRITYPEWDYRTGTYRDPGATVHCLPAQPGPAEWVQQTLAAHRPILGAIRRRFEMLRAEPALLRRRLDGEDIDLEAYLENHADTRAGLARSQALYQTRRPARRSLAISLLVDISGSTDGWVAGNRRIIDVEREALLLVCIALEGLGEPYAVQAFSGEGPHGVTVRELKPFNTAYGETIARSIGALEPEHYTRAGAAIRHATAGLMQQQAGHRLLLILSDGKPNDIDDYEGRYGLEDMRQAVTEARLQGLMPFCLTIDRQAAAYLPRVFGAHQYALLPRPELLPTVLLEWMKRLLLR